MKKDDDINNGFYEINKMKFISCLYYKNGIT